MPTVRHVEEHFQASQSVRDVAIGKSRGPTVPFALAAGISGAVGATSIVVTAERQREVRELREVPERELAEVREILTEFGLDDAHSGTVGKSLHEDPERWVDFMMRFELGLEPLDPRRARRSAFTIGGAYVVGGLVPLLPSMGLRTLSAAVPSSVVPTLLALLTFGAVKARFTGIDLRKGALQTALIGGVAAAAAFGIAALLQ